MPTPASFAAWRPPPRVSCPSAAPAPSTRARRGPAATTPARCSTWSDTWTRSSAPSRRIRVYFARAGEQSHGFMRGRPSTAGQVRCGALIALLLVGLACRCEAPESRTLFVVHAGDMEGELLPREGEGGIARFSALVRALRALDPERTLVVAAGATFIPWPAPAVRPGGPAAPALDHRVPARHA